MEIGQIVWVKVQDDESSGTCWWPGLIQTREELTHGCLLFLVSFFDHQHPRRFQLSQIRSFSENFLQLYSTEDIDRCSGANAMLDSALRLLCRRIALSLRCRCRSEISGSWLGDSETVVGTDAFEAKSSFRPKVLLDFVQNKAVLPYVEVEGFIGAVRGIAQMQVLRDFIAIQQREAYREARRGSRCLERGLVADEVCNLEPNFEGHLSPIPVNMNVESDMEKRMSPTHKPINGGVLENNLTQFKQGEDQQSVPEMLVNLQCLALDSFCLEVNCFNITKQNVLRFRNFLSQKLSGLYMKDKTCPFMKNREACFSHLGYFKTQQSVDGGGNKCDTTVSCSIVPYMERPRTQLGCKRSLDLNFVSDSPLRKLRFKGQLDQSVVCDSFKFSERINRIDTEVALFNSFFRGLSFFDPSSKLCPTVPFFSYNHIDPYAERSHNGWKENSSHNILSGSPDKLEIQSSRTHIATYTCNSSLLENFHNVSDFSLCKDSAYHGRNIVDILKDEELKVKDTYTSSVKLEEPDVNVGVLKEPNRTLITCHDSARGRIGTVFQSEDMKVDTGFTTLSSSAADLNFSEIVSTRATDVENGENDLGTQLKPSELHLNHDKIQMKPCDNKGVVTYYKNTKNVSSTEASKVGLHDSEMLHEPLQSNALARFASSKSLFLKFYVDSNLPSKQELVKKYSPFGSVDYVNTKIFCSAGSAKVAFLNQSDAVVAYQHSKMKKLFPGQLYVRYWVDSFINTRGKTKLLTRKQLEPKLKSCLRNSKSHGNEDKKRRKVRFLMET
ncbi:uncharacterized protein LOC115705951 isoform X2 [Cannabis sativa]|uniref:uncharacterized protein LOC115705951 isoform X2 n=1 Tax=Cannabis sativa TaxID=3483 RepID=UPI0029CA8634|nr:uncharacterized protein LOC115705951 isoform X2 [Cannabis sativa]